MIIKSVFLVSVMPSERQEYTAMLAGLRDVTLPLVSSLNIVPYCSRYLVLYINIITNLEA